MSTNSTAASVASGYVQPTRHALSAFDYVIDPIYELPEPDPAMTPEIVAALEGAGCDLTPQPEVAGWWLLLRAQSVVVERHTFAVDGFDDAQRAGYD